MSQYTREEVIEKVRNGESLKGFDLSGIYLTSPLLAPNRIVGLEWRTNLTGADFREVNLTGANLSDCILCKANLSGAILSDANLSLADLTDAELKGATLNGADLRYANLRYANLEKASFLGTKLGEANCYGAKFNGTDLMGATLVEAKLIKASLLGADLTEANLKGVDLHGADLTLANLGSAGLENANLTDADISGANIYHISTQGWTYDRIICINAYFCPDIKLWDDLKERNKYKFVFDDPLDFGKLEKRYGGYEKTIERVKELYSQFKNEEKKSVVQTEIQQFDIHNKVESMNKRLNRDQVIEMPKEGGNLGGECQMDFKFDSSRKTYDLHEAACRCFGLRPIDEIPKHLEGDFLDLSSLFFDACRDGRLKVIRSKHVTVASKHGSQVLKTGVVTRENLREFFKNEPNLEMPAFLLPKEKQQGEEQMVHTENKIADSQAKETPLQKGKPGKHAQTNSEMEKEKEIPVKYEKQYDGWHWLVDGDNKGVVAKNETRKIHIISQIIIDNIECSTITHKKFLRKLDELQWNDDEYFGFVDKDEDETHEKKSRMQRHITRLRTEFGLDVSFDKDRGNGGVRINKPYVKAK